jgi:hypothetical protein
MTQKIDLTHVRISRDARRMLQILAKTYDRSIREVLDSMVEKEFNSITTDPVNAETPIRIL